MVFTNYREIVRPADAEKWFGITPEAVEATRKQRSEAIEHRGTAGWGGGVRISRWCCNRLFQSCPPTGRRRQRMKCGGLSRG